jgi:hypothetical protein
MVAQPLINPLGTLGCADSFVVAAGAAVPNDDSFWLANSSDMPFDDCIDPDLPGPPTFANLWRVSPSRAEPVLNETTEAPIEEIDVAAAGTGIWMVLRDTGNNDVVVFFDEPESSRFVLGTPSVDSANAIGAIGDRLAVVKLISDPRGGDVSVHLSTREGFSEVLASPITTPFARSQPAILVDGAIALVAYANDLGEIVLMRADCRPYTP